MQIIPTILTSDLKIAQEKLKKYKGIFEWIQLDVIDNVFADNKTLLPADFASIKELSFFRPDIHLITKHPIKFLPDCIKIKSQRIIGHIELMPSQKNFVQEVVKKGVRAGLAVDLPTPIEKLDKNILNKLDVVLLMSVKAGNSGQPLSSLVLPKIKKLVKIKKEEKLAFRIALDGGIKPGTIKAPFNAGAEIFYVGSFLEKEPKKALKNLLNSVKISPCKARRDLCR